MKPVLEWSDTVLRGKHSNLTYCLNKNYVNVAIYMVLSAKQYEIQLR